MKNMITATEELKLNAKYFIFHPAVLAVAARFFIIVIILFYPFSFSNSL